MNDLVTPISAQESADSEGDNNKYVYLFTEVTKAEDHVGGEWQGVRALLGGKGANLADMTRVGVPVPPGFTVTTEACNAYLAAGEQFPGDMWEQVLEAVKATEVETGKKFGDPQNPLLVSARSGAMFSMPGMMDTVLNIGLNDEVVDGCEIADGDKLRMGRSTFRFRTIEGP